MQPPVCLPAPAPVPDLPPAAGLLTLCRYELQTQLAYENVYFASWQGHGGCRVGSLDLRLGRGGPP